MVACRQFFIDQNRQFLPHRIEHAQTYLLIAGGKRNIHLPGERVRRGQDVDVCNGFGGTHRRAALDDRNVRKVGEQQSFHLVLLHAEPIHQHRTIDVSEIVLHGNRLLDVGVGRNFRVVADETGRNAGAEQHQRRRIAVVGTGTLIGADAAAKLAERHRQHPLIDAHQFQILHENFNCVAQGLQQTRMFPDRGRICHLVGVGVKSAEVQDVNFRLQATADHQRHIFQLLRQAVIGRVTDHVGCISGCRRNDFAVGVRLLDGFTKEGQFIAVRRIRRRASRRIGQRVQVERVVDGQTEIGDRALAGLRHQRADGDGKRVGILAARIAFGVGGVIFFEIAAQPARRPNLIGGRTTRPDVRTAEVRPVLIRVTDGLYDAHFTIVKNRLQPRHRRVKGIVETHVQQVRLRDQDVAPCVAEFVVLVEWRDRSQAIVAAVELDQNKNPVVLTRKSGE